MTDNGSLTRRLKKLCPGQFSVQVLDTQWVKPEKSEMKLLSIPAAQRALLREVYLKCGDTVLVYARSVIPLSTLSGKHRRLRYLGNRALGEYLFSIPGLRRATIQWTRTAQLPPSTIQQTASQNKSCWGRRSLFMLEQDALLVSEFFLPALLDPDRE